MKNNDAAAVVILGFIYPGNDAYVNAAEISVIEERMKPEILRYRDALAFIGK